MVKYNANLILAYISGNDLGDYDIDELENDPGFMQSVINYTCDKRMYQLCSENVKRDYDFIKFMITKFKSDFHFVDELASEYLGKSNRQNKEDLADSIELAIIMSKIASTADAERTLEYKLIFSTLLVVPKMEAELVADNLGEGIGFVSILYDFNGRTIITDECARCFIDSIISDNDIDFEEMLHRKFDNVEEVKKYGITNYLIDVISSYDSDLGDYIVTHPNVISDLKNIILAILKNWDSYNQQNEIKRYQIMREQVYRYYKENDVSIFLLSDYELLCLIANDLGILDKVQKYLGEEEEEESFFGPAVRPTDEEIKLNGESDEQVREVESIEQVRLRNRNFSFVEQRQYNDIKQIMINILSQKVVEEPNDYVTNEGNGKVIQITFGNPNSVAKKG